MSRGSRECQCLCHRNAVVWHLSCTIHPVAMRKTTLIPSSPSKQGRGVSGQKDERRGGSQTQQPFLPSHIRRLSRYCEKAYIHACIARIQRPDGPRRKCSDDSFRSSFPHEEGHAGSRPSFFFFLIPAVDATCHHRRLYTSRETENHA